MKTKFHQRHFECFVFGKPQIYKYKMYRELYKENSLLQFSIQFLKAKISIFPFKNHSK